MSLIKQIRIAITFIILMVAAGCLLLSVYDDHRFMAEQLQKKNSDNANALAITLSNIQKDPVTVELIISAQFDMGHYHRIAIIGPDQHVLLEKINRHSPSMAPVWFKRWLPLPVAPGVAAIQSGWKQYGTLVMESEPALAHDQLWQTSRHALLWTLLVACISYAVAGFWLRRILKPLDQVIAQAEALGEREYITIAVPKTLEFQKLVHTMNSLSGRVRQLVTEESQRLSVLNQQINFDEVTGLMNQVHFSTTVAATLKNEQFIEGAVWWVRVANLAEIDHTLGYSATNQLIRQIAQGLQSMVSQHPHWVCGRLAGGVFAVFSKVKVDDVAVALSLRQLLEQLHARHSRMPVQFVLAHCRTHHGEAFSDMQQVMQFIFDLSKAQPATNVRVMNANSIVVNRDDYLGQWRQQLLHAIEHRQIRLERFPVLNKQLGLLHHECVLRLQQSGSDQWLSAGAFIDWAQQLGLLHRLDALALEAALLMQLDSAEPMSLNISAAAMQSPDYLHQLRTLLASHPGPLALSLEVSEETAFAAYEHFKPFVAEAKALGCKVGLEHVAGHLAQLGDLHELGLDYIKFDASLIRDVHQRTQQQSLLQGLCLMVRTMGVLPIAEGVESEEELNCLLQLGFEGLTGPAVRLGAV